MVQLCSGSHHDDVFFNLPSEKPTKFYFKIVPDTTLFLKSENLYVFSQSRNFPKGEKNILTSFNIKGRCIHISYNLKYELRKIHEKKRSMHECEGRKEEV